MLAICKAKSWSDLFKKAQYFFDDVLWPLLLQYFFEWDGIVFIYLIRWKVSWIAHIVLFAWSNCSFGYGNRQPNIIIHIDITRYHSFFSWGELCCVSLEYASCICVRQKFLQCSPSHLCFNILIRQITIHFQCSAKNTVAIQSSLSGGILGAPT
jgi:hypothetical protein